MGSGSGIRPVPVGNQRESSIQLRLLSNLLDGLIAVEGGRKTPTNAAPLKASRRFELFFVLASRPARLRKAENVFARLGIKPGARSIFFSLKSSSETICHSPLPAHPELLLSTAEQGKVWEKALVQEHYFAPQSLVLLEPNSHQVLDEAPPEREPDAVRDDVRIWVTRTELPLTRADAARA